MTSAALAGWFAENDIPLEGEPELALIAGGHSNLTYRVNDTYVLRRPPRGHVLPSAHDVGREHRVIRALEPTAVPVPHSFGLCGDATVLGAPFYVMDLVPGTVVAGHDDGAAYPADARGPACRDLVGVLAAIHDVDVDAAGLGELGRRADYSARQLRRWKRQFHAASTRELPLVDEVHDRLVSAIPPQRRTGLVHGDYRPGNVLLAADGRVNAVLDWELATLGDTMADLGWLTATWREPGEEELIESPAANPGFWSRADLIAEYHRATRYDVSDIAWYQAFALWKLACIAEGVYARYRAGVMGVDGVDVEAQGTRVERLAEAAAAALTTLD
ncbi:phosphotransferase family protein [Cryptosporangium arvum]|uniref:Putative aminoglycoside phosphotransferase n=1 Tax=Cryptosporangium arvum DSM 44712 TaxID=927661 RepID=A0A011A087_9ACTN|nr:phosphotransferase family protein [Cryptosporangium arvum]EXG82902.1 putative aminoglycoside phosphotransferase [Cryptosporangium arvum DSM 44712]